MLERLVRYAIIFGMRRDKHARLEQWRKITPVVGRKLFARTTSRIPKPTNLVSRPDTVSGVPGKWITMPGVSLERLVLYFHGGGFAIGSSETHLGLTAALAQTSGLQVFSVDYRLAPEYPFPAGIEDCLAVYQAMSSTFGAHNLVVAGDSAGGGLVLSVLLEARRLGFELPASVYLLSPWTDLTLSGPSVQRNEATDDMLSPEELLLMRNYYLKDTEPSDVLASPLFADFTGFPPTLIQASKIEILYDDSRRLAENMRKAGVDVVFESWGNMPHVWQILEPWFAEARSALEKAGKFIQRQWEISAE